MKRLLYIWLLVFTFSSCEEYFVPDIDPQEGVLVFEGFISDEEKVHSVTITESVAFNEDRRPEKVSGFRVSIEDDLGNTILLHETDNGVYLTDNYTAGEIGRSYRLVASKNTGELYMSVFEPMVGGSPVDTIDGRATYESVLRYYEGAGYVEETTRGLTVLNNVLGESGKTFYRYEYDVIYQTVQYYPFFPFSYIAYIARPASSSGLSFLSVLNCNLYSGLHAINNPIQFISENIMKYKVVLPHIELDEEGEPFFEDDEIRISDAGFLINLRQYRLSENGYNFWNAINEQSQASGQLFDPVEAQIKGNMYNANDTSKLVFGYFGSSSVTIKGMHLKLRSNDRVDVNSIKYFPDLDEMIDSNVPFDFWVQ